MNPQHDENGIPSNTRPPFLGLVAGTPIRTPTGFTPIEDLKPGDLVGFAPGVLVEEVFVREQPIVLLHLGGVLPATAEHPLHNPDEN
jgi:hypothetical protein